jgi:hypothetical protein
MEFEVAQQALWFAGWVASFMLGRELQTGFSQWKATRRGK